MTTPKKKKPVKGNTTAPTTTALAMVLVDLDKRLSALDSEMDDDHILFGEILEALIERIEALESRPKVQQIACASPAKHYQHPPSYTTGVQPYWYTMKDDN